MLAQGTHADEGTYDQPGFHLLPIVALTRFVCGVWVQVAAEGAAGIAGAAATFCTWTLFTTLLPTAL